MGRKYHPIAQTQTGEEINHAIQGNSDTRNFKRLRGRVYDSIYSSAVRIYVGVGSTARPSSRETALYILSKQEQRECDKTVDEVFDLGGEKLACRELRAHIVPRPHEEEYTIVFQQLLQVIA